MTDAEKYKAALAALAVACDRMADAAEAAAEAAGLPGASDSAFAALSADMCGRAFARAASAAPHLFTRGDR